jgi:photosystem II stability/assembly factor-like uncharacterized protein
MRKSLNLTVLFSVLMVFYLGIEKSSAQWAQAGPNGGSVALIASSGSALYSATVNGFYTSTDNGNTWSIIQSATWPGPGKALAKFGDNLFLASTAGIYRSTDNGLTWIKKYTGSGLCLAANSTTLFAGTSGGVARSTDNGETWTKVAIGSSRNQLAAVAATDTIVYSGDSYSGGVSQSTDNGLTWGVCSNGTEPGRIVGLSIIGTDVYAGTWFSGIWKYTNGTGIWELTNPGGIIYSYNASIVGDATAIIATSFNNVIRSTDGGATWTDVTGNGITRSAMGNGGTAVKTAGGIYVGTNGGLFRTQNNGDIWVHSDAGIKAHSVGAAAALGANIYTATASFEVFRSSDQGQNWTNISTGLIPNTNPNPYTVGLGTNATAVFYDVSMSTNAGNSWTETNAPGRVSDGDLGRLPWLTQNGVYITCDPFTGVSRSTDNSLTWTTSMTGMTGGESSFVNLYSEGSRLYVSTDTGPYYSTDDGQTWILGVIDSYYLQMGGIFKSTGTCMLYGGTGSMSEGTFRSTDHGGHWTPVLAASIERIVVAGTSIYISGRTTVAGTGTNTLYRSDDDGLTWTNITFPLPQWDMYTRTLGASGLNVFISTGSLTTRNIWGSNDGGATWHIVSDNIYPATVATIVILNNKVYACGNSIWSRNLSEFTVPAQPSAITGPATPCIGSSQIYSVTNVYGVTYAWQFPADWVVTAGETTNSVTVTVGSTPGALMVIPSNVFGFGPAQFLAVTPNTIGPDQPGMITGTANPLEGTNLVYSVLNVGGVSYTWAFPSGWVQTAGGTTNSVTVTVGSGSGNISVTPSTPCGTGTARTLAVVTSPANISVSNITIVNGQAQCFNASGTIIVAGGENTFLVQNGGQATFIAGQMISFLPGTTVVEGGYLLGTITTTGQYCGTLPAVKSVTSGTDGLAPDAGTIQFRLYPNPTTGTFTLEQSGDATVQNLKVEIYSMLGERIISDNIIAEKKHQFMLGNVPTGIYLVRILAGEKFETIKLIKQ